MQSDVKQRLTEYLAYLGIGQKAFADHVGLSAGFVNSIRVSIQPKTMEKIATAYPDLNTTWLLTGEGNMTRSTTDKLPDFNELIRKALYVTGYTQKELAEQLDISPSYLSAIKNGEKQPTEILLGKLSEIISDTDCNLFTNNGPEPVDQKSRMMAFLRYKRLSQLKFEQSVNLSRGFVNNIGDNIREATLQKITEVYPDLNLVWLKTGVGNMINGTLSDSESLSSTTCMQVPLLPLAAQGGSLNSFVVTIKERDCELITSPVKGADFAIPVCGESMAPEYPNGSKIFIKKINQDAFIEWGKVYVLDTCNGTVIKVLVPGETKDYVKCVSINKDPIFAPFEVAWKDVYGVYRVIVCLSIK